MFTVKMTLPTQVSQYAPWDRPAPIVVPGVAAVAAPTALLTYSITAGGALVPVPFELRYDILRWLAEELFDGIHTAVRKLSKRGRGRLRIRQEAAAQIASDLTWFDNMVRSNWQLRTARGQWSTPKLAALMTSMTREGYHATARTVAAVIAPQIVRDAGRSAARRVPLLAFPEYACSQV